MDDIENKKNKINNRIHRLKKINKLSKKDSSAYLIKYIPENSFKKEVITCIEREYNITNISKETIEKGISLIQSINSEYFIKIYEYFELPEEDIKQNKNKKTKKEQKEKLNNEKEIENKRRNRRKQFKK